MTEAQQTPGAAAPDDEHIDLTDPTDGESVAPPTIGEPLVVLTDVDKYFGDLHVLQHINLSVRKGEVVVVLGPSGSGKSTLCRAINRLETIQSGSITIDGAGAAGGGQGPRSPPCRRRHGLPVVQPVRPQDDPGERHPRADQGPQEVGGRGQEAGHGAAHPGRGASRRPRSTRRSCPAVSSSASPSPGRWPWTRR